MTQVTIHSLLPQLDFMEVASVIHCASEALRHGCTFSRAYADLGVRIALFRDPDEDCDYVREDIVDMKEPKQLVHLILMASFRLQTLE